MNTVVFRESVQIEAVTVPRRKELPGQFVVLFSDYIITLALFLSSVEYNLSNEFCVVMMNIYGLVMFVFHTVLCCGGSREPNICPK